MAHEHDDDLTPSLEPRQEDEADDSRPTEEEVDREDEQPEPDAAIVRD